MSRVQAFQGESSFTAAVLFAGDRSEETEDLNSKEISTT
jgi:hypothetical protein